MRAGISDILLFLRWAACVSAIKGCAMWRQSSLAHGQERRVGDGTTGSSGLRRRMGGRQRANRAGVADGGYLKRGGCPIGIEHNLDRSAVDADHGRHRV